MVVEAALQSRRADGLLVADASAQAWCFNCAGLALIVPAIGYGTLRPPTQPLETWRHPGNNKCP